MGLSLLLVFSRHDSAIACSVTDIEGVLNKLDMPEAIEAYRQFVHGKADVQVALVEVAFSAMSRLEGAEATNSASVMAAALALEQLIALSPNKRASLTEYALKKTVGEIATRPQFVNTKGLDTQRTNTAIESSIGSLYERGLLRATAKNVRGGRRSKKQRIFIQTTPEGRAWFVGNHVAPQATTVL